MSRKRFFFKNHAESLNLGLKFSYLGISRLRFAKQETIVIFKATSNFLNFLVFWASILRNSFHILNQSPRICLIAKFRAKIKIIATFEISNLEFILM